MSDDDLFYQDHAERFSQVKSHLFNEMIQDNVSLAIYSKNTMDCLPAGRFLRQNYLDAENQRMKTGFQALDKQLGEGLNCRGITQVLGPVSGGKTTFIHHVMRQYLETSKSGTVIYITPIDDFRVLLKRVVCSY